MTSHRELLIIGLSLLVLSVVLVSNTAAAACTDPVGTEGTIIYNADAHIPQYCDGTNWIAMINVAGKCTGSPLCPNIGDICDDGNAGNDPDPVFAGFMLYDGYNCEALYVTHANQSNGIQWAIIENDAIANDSTEDGRNNHSQVVARADYIADPNTFPAFKLCEELTDGGYSDWYLPAREELRLLYYNRDAIGNFLSVYYQTSTETTTTTYYGKTFYRGSDYYSLNKTSTLYDVRCVRR